MLLLGFKIFLALLGLMLVASCWYVSPMIGARSTKAAPVVVTPTLPKVIAIPAIARRRSWPWR